MNYDWQPEQTDLKARIAMIFGDAAKSEIEALETADAAGIRAALLQYGPRLAEAGYMDLSAFGPEGATLAGAMEVLASAAGSLFLGIEASARLFGGLVAAHGGEQLQKEVLGPIRSGRAIGALALSEPGGDEPSEGPLTKARPNSDGYVLTGPKSVCTNAPIADWIAVAADVDGRMAFFIVNPDQDGVSVGERVATLGYNGLAVASLFLTGVKVPMERVIGPFDDKGAIERLNLVQDLVLSAASIGVIHRAHDAAHAYARTHHRGAKPVFAHQEVRFKLADTFTLLQACQLLLYRAAWFMAQGDREGPTLVRCLKVFSAEAAEKVAGLALQVWAGQGYQSGNIVERAFRESKYSGIAGATTEVSRMEIAADMLGLYRPS